VDVIVGAHFQADYASASSPRAVNIRIGKRFSDSSLRTSRQISKPESFGSIKSSKARSGGDFFKVLRPVTPSFAAAHLEPFVGKVVANQFNDVAIISIIRIRFNSVGAYRSQAGREFSAAGRNPVGDFLS